MATIHVSYNGNTEDLDFNLLFPRKGANTGADMPSTEQIKIALTRYYDTCLEDFNDYFVKIDHSGNIIVGQNTTSC